LTKNKKKEDNKSMREILLLRISYTDYATWGVLLEEGVPFALTLEPPWEKNLPNISCIPTGTYKCKKIKTGRHGITFQVLDVPNRAGIIFHTGNLPQETSGCILVGTSFGKLWGKAAILRSAVAMKRFVKRMDEEFLLKIENKREDGEKMTQKVKKWWASKTLWANALAIIAIIAQGQFGYVLTPEAQVAILGLINFVLRIITKEPIKWK